MRIGDVVRCVNRHERSNLQLGRLYRVVNVSTNGTDIFVNVETLAGLSVHGAKYAHRFTPVGVSKWRDLPEDI